MSFGRPPPPPSARPALSWWSNCDRCTAPTAHWIGSRSVKPRSKGRRAGSGFIIINYIHHHTHRDRMMRCIILTVTVSISIVVVVVSSSTTTTIISPSASAVLPPPALSNDFEGDDDDELSTSLTYCRKSHAAGRPWELTLQLGEFPHEGPLAVLLTFHFSRGASEGTTSLTYHANCRAGRRSTRSEATRVGMITCRVSYEEVRHLMDSICLPLRRQNPCVFSSLSDLCMKLTTCELLAGGH